MGMMFSKNKKCCGTCKNWDGIKFVKSVGMNVGGLVGYGYGMFLSNSYVQNVNINIENTNSEVQQVPKETQISSYATQIKDNSPGRLTNIRITSGIINGTIINPGQTFSFNEIVGQPTAARGYQEAKIIMQNTYNVDPHILVIINDQAAAHIFGDNILDTIRQHDWVEGNSRGDAVAMSITSVNPLPIIPDILMGNIRIMLI